jgi:BASS family bile acid:Na+ symporter
MHTLLTVLKTLAAFVLIVDSLSLGLRFPIGQIVATLRHPGALTATILASAIAVPAIAWGVVDVLAPDKMLGAGILLASIGLASPDALRLTELAAGRIPFALALTVIFNLLNVVLIPAWAFLMFPIHVTIDPTDILRTLLFSVFVPYAIGTATRHLAPERALDLGNWLHRLGTPFIVLVFVGALVILLPELPALLGTAALVASLIITATALGLGYLAGGRDADVRRAAAMLTAARANAPAILIAMTNAPGNRRVLLGIVAMIIAGLIVRLPIAGRWRQRYPDKSAGPPAGRKAA